MLTIETAHVRIDHHLPVDGVEISVAPGTDDVGRLSQTRFALMLIMAGAASRSERLLRRVNGRIMAAKAGTIIHMRAKTIVADVAHLAIFSKNGVSRRKRTAGIDILIPRNVGGHEPNQCDSGQS
jgi:hypothetical protein